MKGVRGSDIAGKLETIFSDLMPDEKAPVRLRTRVNCHGWDSLFQLNLVLAIEQEFDVTLADNDAIDLSSFDSALELLQKQMSLKED